MEEQEELSNGVNNMNNSSDAMADKNKTLADVKKKRKE